LLGGEIEMKKRVLPLVALLSILAASSFLVLGVRAQETFFWGADVSSNGTPVTSPALEAGREYRIVASEIFWYDVAANLAADANYYTTDPTNVWDWVSYAYAGQSFLQINGASVDWGSFSNGDTGHTYTIFYTGTGAPLTFAIVDLMDGDYTNNGCHLPVEIWEQPPTEIGKSPGYWGHQFLAHYEGKGNPHHTWAELMEWTGDIDDYYGLPPPEFDGYVLPPVSAMDTDGDGVFTTFDAYTIFDNKKDWKAVWIGCANWFNWAAGFAVYPD